MIDQHNLEKDQQLIRTAYNAFNDRDIDAILKLMDPKVKWPKAWEGDYVVGHEEIRAYWKRQWAEINPKVTPIRFTKREDGSLEVEVDQLVKDLEGNVVFDGKVLHVHLIENHIIKQMDIESME